MAQEDVNSGRLRKVPENFLNQASIGIVLSEAKNGRRAQAKTMVTWLAAGR